MAGHSKWANIKHRKQQVDSKRSLKFQKLITEITKSAQLGGVDVNNNNQLKNLIVRAKQANMPKEVIQRALQRVARAPAKTTYWVECRFAKSASLILKIQTDNLARVMGWIRKIAQRSKLEILPMNSIRFLFQREFYFQLENISEEKLLILLDGLKVENFEMNQNQAEIWVIDLQSVKDLNTRIHQQNISLQIEEEILKANELYKLSSELMNEFAEIKVKLYEIEAVTKIFDNVKQSHKNTSK